MNNSLAAPEEKSDSAGQHNVWYDPGIHRQKFSAILEELSSDFHIDEVREALGRQLIAQWQSKYREVQRRLDSADFTLVILGSFKRGKSTLINALLGLPLVPTDVAPETITVNEIRFGPKVEVEAHLRDGGRVKLQVNDIKSNHLAPLLHDIVSQQGLRFMDQRSPNIKNILNLLTESFSVDELKRCCLENLSFSDFLKDFPSGYAGISFVAGKLVEFTVRRRAVSDLLGWVEEVNQNAYKQFQPYYMESETGLDVMSVTSSTPSLEEQISQLGSKVSHLAIYSPIEWLRGICLVDTPGLGDTDGQFDRQIQAYLPKADAVIFMMSPRSPISGTERAFLKRALMPRDFPKLFFVVNQIDLIPQKEETRVIDNVKKRLEPFFPDASVFGISALCVSDLDMPLRQQDPSRAAALLQSFQIFQSTLDDAILLNRDLICLDRAILEAQLIVNDLMQSVQRLKRSLETDNHLIEERIAQCENEDSELHHRIRVHQQDAQNQIMALYKDACGWMDELFQRISSETIPELGSIDFEDVQKNFHFFLTDMLHNAVQRCLQAHTPIILERMNEARNGVINDIHQLVDSFVSSGKVSSSASEMTFGEVSWNSLDATNLVIDESLITLFGQSDSISVIAISLLHQQKKREASSQIAAYQQSLRKKLPELIEIIRQKLRELYEQIADDIQKHIEASYKNHIEESLASLHQARNLHKLKKGQVDSYGVVFDKLLDLCAQSNGRFDSLRGSLWPLSERK